MKPLHICISVALMIAASAFAFDSRLELDHQYVRLQKDIANTKLFQKTASTALRRQSTILPSDHDPLDVVLRRTQALLDNISTLENAPDLSIHTVALKQLKDKSASISQDQRKELYYKVCKLRRKIALANPLLNFENIIFAKREINPWPEKRGNHMCDQYFGFHAKPGGGIFVLKDIFSDSPELTSLTADAICKDGRFKGKKLQGGFLSPDLSFDGKEILFAFTQAEKNLYKWTPETTFHIFRINADGTNLVQLTDGDTNDFQPCFLPNGRIVFISERRGGYGRCHGRPVPSFTLHTMHDDGTDIVTLSPHETNEWHPSVDNNGMIVYTRWDYVDRGFNQAHHPWTTTPDGRDPRAIQGNYAKNQGDRPHQEMQIRAIPNSTKYVFTASGHHTQVYGALGQLDPSIPDDDKMSMLKRITPEQLFPESEYKPHTGEGMFATPWPLNEDYYLCVYCSKANDGLSGTNHKDHNYGIYLVDSFGNRELIYRDPDFSCIDPIPLRARKKPPVIPHQTLVGLPPVNGKKIAQTPKDQLPKTAPVGLMNVYNTKLPFPEGTQIKALRIIQILPKTTPLANHPRIGYGEQKSARAVLGTVPVDQDGSAYFDLPVGIPVYFQALDKNGLAVQSMRSATWTAPGEKLTCNGCHEPRNSAPKPMKVFPTALKRNPSKITPDVDGSNPFSFPRLVQPILDKNCVPCHTKNIEKGNKKSPDLRKTPVSLALTANAKDRQKRPNWYISYANLKPYSFYFDDRKYTTPRTIPGKFGAADSKLYKMLKAGHHDVKLSKEEMHRITLWQDCNSDFYGSYENTKDQAAGKIVKPTMQ